MLLWIIRLKKQLNIQKNKIEDFDYFLDNTPLFIDAFDEKGKCVLWNKECKRIFGWSIDEINSEKNSLALFYPDVEDQKIVLELLNNDKASELNEYYPQTKEGKVIISLWAIIPIPNGYNIGIGYDISHLSTNILRERTLQLNQTKQKLAEFNISLENRVKLEIEKNKEHQKIMIFQSRHAQMGETLSIIAHQWRQPLNNLSLIIQNAIFQYKSGKFSDATIQTLDTESFKQIQEMSQTISNFKNFFKPNNILRQINLSNAIDNALNIVIPSLKSQNIFLHTILKNNLYVTGYSSELEQAIINILLNARDILANKNIKKKSILLEVKSNEKSITISIKDNGGGVALDIIDDIFNPYFSTKSNKNGTGLGLYITKIIIEDHMKGNLSLHNDKKGAVFIINLNSFTP